MAAHGYRAKRLTLAEYRQAVEAGGSLALTPFQEPDWLEAWVDTIGDAIGSELMLLAVHEADTGGLALILTWALRRERGLAVIEGIDEGVSDYNAPVLGPAAPAEPGQANALWAAILQTLPPADVIRIIKMPVTVQSRANPLAFLPGIIPSTLFGNVITISGTIESHLRGSDRKARKEYERYLRRAQDFGAVRLRRAGQASAGRLMDELERHQQDRVTQSGRDYVLDRPQYVQFYRALLARSLGKSTIADASRRAFADLFYLELDGRPAAFLYGVRRATDFSLLRITHTPGEHERFSPGRVIIGETLRALRDLGVQQFDMTIGDYLSKRVFAPIPYPLVELHQPLSLAGHLLHSVTRAKNEIRKRPRLRAAVAKLRRR